MRYARLLLVALVLASGVVSFGHTDHPERRIENVTFFPNGTILVERELYVPAKECAEKGGDEEVKAFSVQWFVNVGVVMACVCMAALAAGLTLSVGSIDPMRLEVILTAASHYKQYAIGDQPDSEEAQVIEQESKCAQRLLPIIAGPLGGHDEESGEVSDERGHQCWWSHHLLLVTLLLCNSAANEILPLFLDKLVPSWVAIILSVTFVLFFGEIIPSALFTSAGRKLPLAAALVPLVKLLLTIAYPIAFPIAKVLDKVLGHGDEPFRKEELRALIMMHGLQEEKGREWRACCLLTPIAKEIEVEQVDRPAHLLKALRVGTDGSSPTSSEALFAAATCDDLENWLAKVIGEPMKIQGTMWQVQREPRSRERRGQHTTRAWVLFRSEIDMYHAVRKINESRTSLFNSVVIKAEACERPPGFDKFKSLDRHEVEIMDAVLDLDVKKAGEEATPMPNVFMLRHDEAMTPEKMREIRQSGYSRVPLCHSYEVTLPRAPDDPCFLGIALDQHLYIQDTSGAAKESGIRTGSALSQVVCVNDHPVRTLEDFVECIREDSSSSVRLLIQERGFIRGMLLSKALIDPSPPVNVASDRESFSMIAVHPSTNLAEVLRAFQESKRHLAIVTEYVDDFEMLWKELDTGVHTPLVSGNSSFGHPRPPRNEEILEELRKKGCTCVGIITLEDVLEELVGDIDDEFDARDLERKARLAAKIHKKKQGKVKTWQSLAHQFSRPASHSFKARQSAASGSMFAVNSPLHPDEAQPFLSGKH